MRTIRPSRLLIAVALLAAAAAALLIADRGPAPASAESRAASYAVLGASAAAAPRSPSRRATLEDVAVHVTGLDLDAARVLDDGAAESVVLVPRGSDQLCVVRLMADGTAGGSCETNDIADARGIISGSLGHTSGVVPDGVDHVDFTLSNGSHTSTAVTHNVFTAPPEAVSGTYDVGGAVQTVEMIPRSQAPVGAVDVG